MDKSRKLPKNPAGFKKKICLEEFFILCRNNLAKG
jgi:hypothetical protein